MDVTGNVWTGRWTWKVQKQQQKQQWHQTIQIHIHHQLPTPDISIRPSGEGAKAVLPQSTNHCQAKTRSSVRTEFHYRQRLQILLPLSTKTAEERTWRKAHIGCTSAGLCKLFLSAREQHRLKAANAFKTFFLSNFPVKALSFLRFFFLTIAVSTVILRDTMLILPTNACRMTVTLPSPCQTARQNHDCSPLSRSLLYFAQELITHAYRKTDYPPVWFTETASKRRVSPRSVASNYSPEPQHSDSDKTPADRRSDSVSIKETLWIENPLLKQITALEL